MDPYVNTGSNACRNGSKVLCTCKLLSTMVPEAPSGCPAALALMACSWLAQLGVVGDGGAVLVRTPHEQSLRSVLAWGPGAGIGREALRNEILSWD